jgi:hypothetical protein
MISIQDLVSRCREHSLSPAVPPPTRALLERVWLRIEELDRPVAVAGVPEDDIEREELHARVEELTREVARLQAGASAVHASALQARTALSELEELAAGAALPWRRGQGLGGTR